jgi:hypothetical protein
MGIQQPWIRSNFQNTKGGFERLDAADEFFNQVRVALAEFPGGEIPALLPLFLPIEKQFGKDVVIAFPHD